MATKEFHYQHPFPLGEDKTEYYLLTKDHVSVSEFEGKPILKIEKEGLTKMANAAFRDVSFMLRREHNMQVAKILSDPEASDNDKYVALTFLRNAEVAAKGMLPFCQDTGTAIIHGEKGQQVWTGYCDEEALSLGVYKTYTEENLRYSGEGNCLVERETGKLILGCGSSVIPDGVREIGDNAFLGNRLIRSLVLPASIERIGDAAFFECGALVSVTYLGTREQWEAVEKGARWKDYAAFDEVRFGP